MTIQNRLAISLFVAAFGLAACSAGSGDTEVHASSSAAEDTSSSTELVTPVLDTLETRAIDRWDAIVAQEWIQAYDYLPDSLKKQLSLSEFLSGKEYHEYRNPTRPYLLGTEGDKAYLEVSVLWQPHHPEVLVAANNPGDLTQEMHVIETWVWEDGEWCWITTERQREFLAAHPQLAELSK
jgi:hypothetical protein